MIPFKKPLDFKGNCVDLSWTSRQSFLPTSSLDHTTSPGDKHVRFQRSVTVSWACKTSKESHAFCCDHVLNALPFVQTCYI